MRKLLFFIVLVLLISCKEEVKFDYIKTPVNIVTENYYGLNINDPYRYMEDYKDSTYLNWLKKQNTFTQSYLNNINNRELLKSKIKNLNKNKLFSISRLRISKSNTYYYIKKNNKESINKLCVKKGFLGKEIILFNSNDFSPNSNDNYLINYIQPSWDESKIIIGLSKNDEEFSKLIIYDLINDKLYPDVVDHIWPNSLGGIEWLPDNSSFIYTYIPTIDPKHPNYLLNSRAVIYRLGKLNKFTTILSKKSHPNLNFKEEEFPICSYSYKSKYLLVEKASVGIYRDTYIIPIKELKNPKWKLLFSKEEQINQFYLKGNEIFYKTSKNTSNFKICKTSMSHPNFNKPTILVKEDKNAVITDFAITKEGVFFTKVKNGVEAKLYQLQEGIEEITLPKPSGYIGIDSNDTNSDYLFIHIEGWINNLENYRYDINKKSFKEENISPVIKYNELENVIVEEKEIISYDGTKVPLSIIYKKGLKKNGKNRILMMSYGAYKYSLTPHMYPYILHWINNDGVYVISHVRGGGEKGNNWHKGGFKKTKPNTWKDLIASTEYLIKNEYTEPSKIAIWSASAGAIGIGRAITERPDLYTAAIIKVGDFNTLRSENAPNGKNNTKEFGTVKDSLEFKYLLEMDSYHHVKDSTSYPAVYLLAGINDSRTAAWQSAKFVARLQSANNSDKPIFLSVDFNGGHGFEANSNKKIQETTDVISFALWQTGHPDYQYK